MLKITEQNRSYICLEDTESGVCFFHYKSLRAFDKNLAMYNELHCYFVREVGECYEDEVDVYSYGELYESQ